MEVTIMLKAEDPIEAATIKRNLQIIADNINKDNIVFLAKQSVKKDINKKLDDKKVLINTFL